MNNSKLTSRKIKEEDWSILEEWWSGWPDSLAPPKDSLPGNGTDGIIIEDNGKPVIAGFIYQTNSKLAMLEGLISDPNYKDRKKRDVAVHTLLLCLQEAAKIMGYKYIFGMTENKRITNLRTKFGWCLNAKPNYVLTKIL